MSNSLNIEQATSNNITINTDNEATIGMHSQLAELGLNLGEFKPYDSQLPIADINGTRIVKMLYQKGKDGKKKVAQNSYVRIPTAHLTEQVVIERIVELAPYVLSYLQEQEDVGIKEMHKAAASKIYCEHLDLDKIIERMEASNEGARLNKEKIEAWFTECLQGSLIVMFADKLAPGIEINDLDATKLEKLELVINAYKAKFASLASPKTFIQEEDCASMIKVLDLASDEGSNIAKRFIARLEKMSQKQDNLLMSL